MVRREEKIFLHLVKNNSFDIINRNGQILLNSDDDYFIYLKNVNFKRDGVIEGRYLGKASKSMIDRYCKDVAFESDGFKVDGKIVNTARMVAIDNKNRTVIIIES